MARRSIALIAVLGLALALAATAVGATVTVRVEGKTQPIFGSVPVKVDAPNALVALDVASMLGEFYVQVTQSSFGPYVSQIGRYPGAGSSGWVFKVNGASPPVGADKVTLRDGDEVLWYYATFSATGGQPTLLLHADAVNCYTVSSDDDLGKGSRRSGRRYTSTAVDFKVGATGRVCVGHHDGDRACICRRRRAVERREVRLRYFSPLLLVALALAGCGAEGPTAADGTARLWVTRDRGRSRARSTTVPAGQTLLRALQVEGEADDAIRRRLRPVDRRHRGKRSAA